MNDKQRGITQVATYPLNGMATISHEYMMQGTVRVTISRDDGTSASACLTIHQLREALARMEEQA